MSSFINLMADDVWSEADIVSRTEAIIRGHFSREAEDILNRKVTGALLGQYALTPAEQADLGRYAAMSEQARAEGVAARADMALLAQAMEVEAAWRAGEPLPEMAAELAALVEARGRCVGEPPAPPAPPADEPAEAVLPAAEGGA